MLWQRMSHAKKQPAIFEDSRALWVENVEISHVLSQIMSEINKQ
jgi:hypothetical protein